jgi:hypothetical protein
VESEDLEDDLLATPCLLQETAINELIQVVAFCRSASAGLFTYLSSRGFS